MRAPTKCRAQNIVEVFVDALRLPLAVHRARRLGEFGVVAGSGGDSPIEPIPQGLHDRRGQQLQRRSHDIEAVNCAPVIDRRAVVEARRAGECRVHEFIADRLAIAGSMLSCRREQGVEVGHRCLAPQGEQHIVLLIGEQPLQLAGGHHDERRELRIAA